jgi:hypothetical protein
VRSRCCIWLMAMTTSHDRKRSGIYAYTLDSASAVPSLLRTFAGPQLNIG